MHYKDPYESISISWNVIRVLGLISPPRCFHYPSAAQQVGDDILGRPLDRWWANKSVLFESILDCVFKDSSMTWIRFFSETDLTFWVFLESLTPEVLNHSCCFFMLYTWRESPGGLPFPLFYTMSSDTWAFHQSGCCFLGVRGWQGEVPEAEVKHSTAGWWQLKDFLMFIPIWENDSQFDEHIFQWGWNHQLDNITATTTWSSIINQLSVIISIINHQSSLIILSPITRKFALILTILITDWTNQPASTIKSVLTISHYSLSSNIAHTIRVW